MPTLPVCQAAHLGILEYQQAWDLQLRLAQEIRDCLRPNILLLLEHLPVFTKGRMSKTEHVLLDSGVLQDKGIAIFETDRGGQVTFHGPGQLVAYPVVSLKDWGGPVKYVRTLEHIIIDTLADFDVTAGLVEGLTGVWVGDAKIAAIGLKISRGVAYHGFAINVNTDLDYYDYIVPCGIEDRPVTSLSKALGGPVEMEQVRYSLTYHFGQAMDFKMVEADFGLELAEEPIAVTEF